LKYILFVHLLDQSGRIVAQADHEQVPGALTVPYVAKARENWRDVVRLSRSQLKGVTRIALGILELPGTFVTADRGERDWDNRRLIVPVSKELSRLVQPEAELAGGGSATVFEDELSLTGYSVANNKGQAEIALRWNVLRKPFGDYNVFVHVLDGSGTMAFQADHPLKNVAGAQSGAWTAGDSVEDRFLVAPPVNRAPGSYTLRIGVWDPKTARFLKLVRTNLPQPTDGWRGRVVLIENVECK